MDLDALEQETLNEKEADDQDTDEKDEDGSDHILIEGVHHRRDHLRVVGSECWLHIEAMRIN